MVALKQLSIAALITIFIGASLPRLTAADAPAAAPSTAAQNSVTAEFEAIFERINAKLKDGKNTEPEFSAEIAAIDSLLAKHASEKTDEVAMIALVKAKIYFEVFEDAAKGVALLKQLKIDFPQSEIARNIDQAIDALEKEAAASSKFVVGKPFPPFSEKDINDKPLSLADFKGKIVLVDFWATWCGPCVRELPNVLAAYEKFHSKGFEIIGISLDKNKELLTAFTKEHGMTWVQYFDGLVWENKLVQQYDIHSIPATFLLDGDGIIIAKRLRGPALDKKLTKLLK